MNKLAFFVVSFVVSFFIGYIRKRNEKISIFLSLLFSVVLSFVFAYREYFFPETIGNDYYNYQIWFETWDFSRTFRTFQYFGFNFLISFIKLFTSNFHFFLFICSFIINSLIIYQINSKSKNLFLSLIVYLLLFYFSTFNITRQWIACSIFLISFKYLEDEKFVKYCAIVALATLFHDSALILLIVYPIINFRKDSKYKEPLILLFGLFAFFNFNKIVDLMYLISGQFGFNYLEKYSNADSFFEVGNYTSFILAFIAYFAYKFLKIDKKNDVSKKKSVYLCMCVVICLLKATNVIFNRLSVYFFVSLLFIVPDIVKKFKNKDSIIVELLIVILLLIAFII